MKPTITAFEASPDKGQGLARDMRVRWALEEVGQPYDVELLSFKEMKQPAHLARSPFGQIPTFEEGDLTLSETGAIILHIAEAHDGLLPTDPIARKRAIMWMFAALSSVEPSVIDVEIAELFEADKPWGAERMAMVRERAHERLERVSDWLGDKDWLEGEFSAGDLMMVEVLERIKDSGLLEPFPNLVGYVARGEARPSFKRAFDAQRAVFLAGEEA